MRRDGSAGTRGARRFRRGIAMVAGLLLVVGASTIGLDDLAESHLGAAAQQSGLDEG